MKVIVLFYNQKQTWVRLKTSLFSDGKKHIYSFIHSLLCLYPGALHTGGISGVFLVNLKIGLMHYENHTLASIKCST